MDRIAPNLKAFERLEKVTGKLKESSEQFDSARREAKQAKEQFKFVREKRFRRFMEAYRHISGHIDMIYKELTKSTGFPLGGTAYLSLENSEVSLLEV